MPLWLTHDNHGYSLFAGATPPDWDDGCSMSNDVDDDSEYLGEVPTADVAMFELPKGRTMEVVLSRKNQIG